MTNDEIMAAQVGGTHYKGMTYQPIELAMDRGYDACVFSVLKYVSRHRQKNGRQDLEKALHFVKFRKVLKGDLPDASVHANLPEPSVGIDCFIGVNEVPFPESAILRMLDSWNEAHGQHYVGEAIANGIRDLIETAYPEGN